MFPSDHVALACLGMTLIVFVGLWRLPKPDIPAEVVLLASAGAAVVLTLAFGGGFPALGLSGNIQLGSLLAQAGGIYLAIILSKLLLVDLLLVRRLGLAPADLEAEEKNGNRRLLARELLRSLTASTAEEILFRGFLLGVLVFLAGGEAAPLGLKAGAVLLTAAAFGGLHYRQGVAGAATAGLVGVVFGLAWLLNGGDLVPLIVTHILINVVTDIVLYAERREPGAA